MSRLTKAQRETVRQMFDGRCAYCGESLPDRWHADHVEPVWRELIVKSTDRGTYRLVSGKPTRPELDVISNNMPACPPCNISKGAMSVESWRGWLAGHINSLNAYHPIYRLARKYDLVRETGAAVTFYFERVATPSTDASGAGADHE